MVLMSRAVTTSCLRAALVALLLMPVPAWAQEVPGVERTGWLGISIQESWTLREGECDLAVVVEQVYPGAPADRAGLTPGDVLLQVNGTRPEEGLERLTRSLRAGDAVHFIVRRGDASRELVAVAGQRPETLVRSVSPRTVPRPGRERQVRLPEAPFPTAVFHVAPDSVVVCGEGFGRIAMVPRPDFSFRVVQERADSLRQILTQRALEARIAVDTLNERVFVYAPRVAVGVPVAEKALPPVPGVIWLNEDEPQAVSVESLQVSIAFPAPPEKVLRAEDVVRGRVVGEGDVAGTLLNRGSRAVAGAEFAELNPDLARYFRGASEGLLVLQVVHGTPAARAGLRPGDVVVTGNGEVLSTVEKLRSLIALRADRPVTLEVVRNGRSRTLTLAWD